MACLVARLGRTQALIEAFLPVLCHASCDTTYLRTNRRDVIPSFFLRFRSRRLQTIGLGALTNCIPKLTVSYFLGSVYFALIYIPGKYLYANHRVNL